MHVTSYLVMTMISTRKWFAVFQKILIKFRNNAPDTDERGAEIFWSTAYLCFLLFSLVDIADVAD